MVKNWLLKYLDRWGGGITTDFCFLVDGALEESGEEYETPPGRG